VITIENAYQPVSQPTLTVHAALLGSALDFPEPYPT
jgi:hypothetical protein